MSKSICNELIEAYPELEKFPNFLRQIRRSIKTKDNFECLNLMKKSPLFDETTINLFENWQLKWQNNLTATSNCDNLLNQIKIDLNYFINVFLEYFPANLLAFYPKW